MLNLGDPLELATFEASGYAMDQSGMQFTATVAPNGDRGTNCISSIRVLHRYPFSSSLKRMSVLVEATIVNGATSEKYILAVCKGAPEVIASKLKYIPFHYRSTYLYHMGRGKRVLAFAARVVDVDVNMNPKSLLRDDVENGLTFSGFTAFDSELKSDTKSVMKVLRHIDAKVVMITGDSAYTAADVARKLKLLVGAKKSSSKIRSGDETSDLGQHSFLLLMVVQSKGLHKLVWRKSSSGDSTSELSTDIYFDLHNISSEHLGSLSKSSTLCVTGPALSFLEKGQEVGMKTRDYQDILQKICPYVSIYARVSPTQKESIIHSYNGTGGFTLMVGDGTNDVGALRAAHVGVSVINCPDLEDKIEKRGKIRKEGLITNTEETVGTDGVRSRKNAKSYKAYGDNSQKVGVARLVTEMEAQNTDPT